MFLAFFFVVLSTEKTRTRCCFPLVVVANFNTIISRSTGTSFLRKFKKKMQTIAAVKSIRSSCASHGNLFASRGRISLYHPFGAISSSTFSFKQEQKNAASEQKQNGNVLKVKVPQMGESITSGTVGEWLKNVSDFVKADEVVTTIDTDKVVLSI